MNYTKLRQTITGWNDFILEHNGETKPIRFEQCCDNPWLALDNSEEANARVKELTDSGDVSLALTPDKTKLALPYKHFVVEFYVFPDKAHPDANVVGPFSCIISEQYDELHILLQAPHTNFPYLYTVINQYGKMDLSDHAHWYLSASEYDPSTRKTRVSMTDDTKPSKAQAQLRKSALVMTMKALMVAWLNNCPNYRRFQVLPNGHETKSAKWRRSREHEVFLTSAEVAQRQARGRSGSGDPQDLKGHPQASERASHARRAHTRTLKHERYRRNPDGSYQQVWVDSTWVGPEEFRSDQKHYRIAP